MKRLPTNLTNEEQEIAFGEALRTLRLDRNLNQKALAEQAGLSLRAVQNLEQGAGSTLNSLIGVLRVLGREDWLKTLAPVATINPLLLTRQAKPRQRARRRANTDG